MYIKSIVLEGFKSYGNRVEINGFDPQFNAITGNNGSGKSNILDSICFVLGIQNLQQVTDLLFKSDVIFWKIIIPLSVTELFCLRFELSI